MNLTKNFTFEEMTKSETALRFSLGLWVWKNFVEDFLPDA